MKTTILSFLIVASTVFTVQAQDTFTKAKGSFFANGSVLINTTTHKVNDAKASSFGLSFNPKAGYFIKENLAVGAEILLRSTTDTQEVTGGDIESSTFAVGFMPLARYYFDQGFFGEAAVGITSQKTTGEGALGDTEFTASGFGFRVGAGYALHLGQHVAIEPGLNYSWESINPKDAPDGYEENLSSIYLSIGLTAFF